MQSVLSKRLALTQDQTCFLVDAVRALNNYSPIIFDDWFSVEACQSLCTSFVRLRDKHPESIAECGVLSELDADIETLLSGLEDCCPPTPDGPWLYEIEIQNSYGAALCWQLSESGLFVLLSAALAELGELLVGLTTLRRMNAEGHIHLATDKPTEDLTDCLSLVRGHYELLTLLLGLFAPNVFLPQTGDDLNEVLALASAQLQLS